MSANDNSKNDIRFDDPYGGGPAATLCLDLYVRLAKLRLRRLSVGKVAGAAAVSGAGLE